MLGILKWILIPAKARNHEKKIIKWHSSPSSIIKGKYKLYKLLNVYIWHIHKDPICSVCVVLTQWRASTFFLEERTQIEKNKIKVHEFIELHTSWFKVMTRGNESLLEIFTEAGTLWDWVKVWSLSSTCSWPTPVWYVKWNSRISTFWGWETWRGVRRLSRDLNFYCIYSPNYSSKFKRTDVAHGIMTFTLMLRFSLFTPGIS